MLRLFRKILGSWKQVDTRTSGLRQRLECCQSADTSGPPFSCGRTVTCDAHREVHKSRASPKPPQSTQLRHWLWCRSACRASAAPSDRGDHSQVKSGIGNSAAEAIGSGVVALGELQQLLLGIRKPAFWRRRRVANAPIRGSAYRHLLTTSLGQLQSFAMWVCIHPSFRTVWRKTVEEA